MDKKIENVIVIGGGVAGLSAALYNSRANLDPLLLAGSPPGGQLTLTTEVENFPSRESILGPELIEKMRSQVKKFGTRIIDKNVIKVDFSQKPFKVYTTGVSSEASDVHQSNAIIIATGAKALWLNLPSEQRLRGKGISACATCDGFFFKNKAVAVIGGGDTAMEEALTLTKFATKIYIIHRRDSFRASKIMQDRVLNCEKIEVIWNASVEEVLGDLKVEGARLKVNGSESKEIKVDGVFLAIGHKPDVEVFKGQIDFDEKGYILTSARATMDKAINPNAKIELNHFNLNYQSSTSVHGVFAAGDCVDHVYRQAATAAGMGVSAALDTERYLELGQ